jgi:hypothetical protein
MTITRLSNDVLTSHHLQTWKHLITFTMEGAYFRTPPLLRCYPTLPIEAIFEAIMLDMLFLLGMKKLIYNVTIILVQTSFSAIFIDFCLTNDNFLMYDTVMAWCKCNHYCWRDLKCERCVHPYAYSNLYYLEFSI